MTQSRTLAVTPDSSVRQWTEAQLNLLVSFWHLFMSDFDKERWIELYRTAILELEHAKMAGCIGDARTAIAARIEKLHDLPGLHAHERQAIVDALNGLRSLEREEERYAENERRIAEAALEKLRVIAPRIESA